MYYSGLTYNIYFELSAAIYLVILLTYQLLQFSYKSKLNKVFNHLLLLTLLTDSMDVISAITISYASSIPLWINICTNTAYFLANNFMGMYFVYYFALCISQKNQTEEKHPLVSSSHIIACCYAALLVLNMFTGWIFHFDASYRYIHGPLYPLVFIIPYVFMIMSAIYVFINISEFNTAQRVSMLLYFLFGFSGSIVQIVFLPTTLINMFCISLGIIMIFFTMETQDYKQLVETLAQLQQAQIEAEEAREIAENANEAKSQFLANMSHEIRTPVNAVMGLNEMILRESNELNIREYSVKVSHASESLLSVINDVLDISKIEAGKMTVIPVEYSLAGMLDTLVNMISLKAESKGLEFKLTYDDTLPSMLYGDDVKLRQVITNLLSNAVKYTPSGTVDLIVSGSRSLDSQILRFEIKDSGIGIKPEDMGRLFANYERLEERLNHGVEGTGLGLSITSHLLRLMGSSLEVSSTYGKGSTFAFNIHQDIVDSTPIGPIESLITQKARDFDYHESFIAPNANVLVVDDTELNLFVFSSLLKKTKIKIDTASSGFECLELVNKKHYDIIFMDHMMPTMDGIETLEHIKEMKETIENFPCATTPVIVLTANAISGMKEMYLSKGFDNFLSKPVEFVKLERMICQYLPNNLLEDGSDEASITDITSTSEDRFDTLPKLDNINWKFAKTYIDDYDILISTVSNIYRSIEKDIDNISELLFDIDTDENMDLFRIAAHTIKSSYGMIGASQISGLAKTLEFAARDKKATIIKGVTPSLISCMKALRNELSTMFEEKDSSAKEASYDKKVIIEKLLKLDDAGMAMDMDLMDEIMSEIDNYQYPDNVSEDIKKLQAAVADLDSDLIHTYTCRISENL